MSRRVRTPQERAQEVVNTLEARLDRLEKSKSGLLDQAAKLQYDIEATEARLKHARTNPDLVGLYSNLREAG